MCTSASSLVRRACFRSRSAFADQRCISHSAHPASSESAYRDPGAVPSSRATAPARCPRSPRGRRYHRLRSLRTIGTCGVARRRFARPSVESRFSRDTSTAAAIHPPCVRGARRRGVQGAGAVPGLIRAASGNAPRPPFYRLPSFEQTTLRQERVYERVADRAFDRLAELRARMRNA